MAEQGNKLKAICVKIAKENPTLRKFMRLGLNAYRKLIFAARTWSIKTDEKTVVFSCFKGASYACSPKAIYEYLISDERYKDYKFIWAFKNTKKYQYLTKNPNTTIVKQGSKEHMQALALAKYWCVNYKVMDYLKPKSNQVFIQCWHGTPLKMLGCDLEHYDNVMNTIKGMKMRYRIEAKKFDYFLSPSKYASEKFISAWDLRHSKKENIILEEGYPRNDFLSNYTEEDKEKFKKKFFKEDYENVKGKKIVLYAPTYRAHKHIDGLGYAQRVHVDFDMLQEKLKDDYVVLFRSHYLIANAFDFKKYESFVYDASKIDDVNKLFVISDILITDYSSVMFDYSILKRPMIFFMYDMEHYRDESNGFYIDIEKELPGPIIQDKTLLADEIVNMTKNFVFDEKYKAFNDKYNYLEDGKASQRVVNKIFK